MDIFFWGGGGQRIIIESFISNQRIYCTVLDPICVTHNKYIIAHFFHSLKREKYTYDSLTCIQSLTTIKMPLKRIKKWSNKKE